MTETSTYSTKNLYSYFLQQLNFESKYVFEHTVHLKLGAS